MHSFLKSSLDELSTITSSNPDIHLLVEQAKDQLQTEVVDYESITTPFIMSFLSLKKVPDVILRNIKYFLETDKIKKDVYPQLLKCISDRGYKDIKSLQIASLLAYKLNSSELITLFKYVYGIKTQESEMICKQIILIVTEKFKKNTNNKLDELESDVGYSLNNPKNDCISLFNFILSLDDLELVDLFLENADFLEKKEIFNKVEKNIKNNLKHSLKLIGKLKLTSEIKALIIDNLSDYKLISKFFTDVALNKYEFQMHEFKEEMTLINEYILLGHTLNTNPKEKDTIRNINYYLDYYKDIKITNIQYDINLLDSLSKQNTASFPVIYSKIADDKNILLNIMNDIPKDSDLYSTCLISLLKMDQKEGIDLLSNFTIYKVIDFIYDYNYLKERSKEMDDDLLISLLKLLNNPSLVKEIYLINIKRMVYSKFDIFTKLNYIDSDLIKEYFLHCKDVNKEIEVLPFIYLRSLIQSNTYDLVIILEVILRYDIYYKYIYKEILLIFKEIILNNNLLEGISNDKSLINDTTQSSYDNILYIINNAMNYFINELIIYTDLINDTLEVLRLLHDITLYKELGNHLLNNVSYHEKYLLLLLEENDYFLEVVYWFIKKSNNPCKSVLIKLLSLENKRVISFVNDYLKDNEVIQCYLNKSYDYLVKNGSDSEIGILYLQGLKKIINNEEILNDKSNVNNESISLESNNLMSQIIKNNKIMNDIKNKEIMNDIKNSNDSITLIKKNKRKNKRNKSLSGTIPNDTLLTDNLTINNDNLSINDNSLSVMNDNSVSGTIPNDTSLTDNLSINNDILSINNNNSTFKNDKLMNDNLLTDKLMSVNAKIENIINNTKLNFNPSFYNTLLLLLNKSNIFIINKLLDNKIPLDISLILKVLNELICKGCVCNNYEESILISLKLSKENESFINLVKENIKRVNNDLFDKINTSLLCLLFNEEKNDRQSLIIDILILLINHNTDKSLSIKSISNKIYKNISDEYLLVKYFTNLNEEYLDLFIKIIKERKEVLLITLSFDKIYLYNKEESKRISSLIINDYIKKHKIYDRLIDKKDIYITRHVLQTVKDKEVLLSLKDELFDLMRNKCFLNELEELFYIMMSN